MGVLKLIAWVSLAISVGWLLFKPGFDSASALAVSLLALIGLYLSGKKKVEKASVMQSQKISGCSTGIQAGRDVVIGKERHHSDC